MKNSASHDNKTYQMTECRSEDRLRKNYMTTRLTQVGRLKIHITQHIHMQVGHSSIAYSPLGVDIGPTYIMSLYLSHLVLDVVS